MHVETMPGILLFKAFVTRLMLTGVSLLFKNFRIKKAN
jgi:hypothetical protein